MLFHQSFLLMIQLVRGELLVRCANLNLKSAMKRSIINFTLCLFIREKMMYLRAIRTSKTVILLNTWFDVSKICKIMKMLMNHEISNSIWAIQYLC